MLGILERAGFRSFTPSGAYYVMTDISGFGFDDDVEFARHLVRQVGVAAVPGSSFYREPGSGRHRLRFCFAKKDETLRAAGERLARSAGDRGRAFGVGLQGRAPGRVSGSGLKARASGCVSDTSGSSRPTPKARPRGHA